MAGSALQTFGKHLQIAEGCASFPSCYPLLALDRTSSSSHGELLDVAALDSPLSRRASDYLSIQVRRRVGGSPTGVLP